MLTPIPQNRYRYYINPVTHHLRFPDPNPSQDYPRPALLLRRIRYGRGYPPSLLLREEHPNPQRRLRMGFSRSLRRDHRCLRPLNQLPLQHLKMVRQLQTIWRKQEQFKQRYGPIIHVSMVYETGNLEKHERQHQCGGAAQWTV